jgi:hypothetical protein
VVPHFPILRVVSSDLRAVIELRVRSYAAVRLQGTSSTRMKPTHGGRDRVATPGKIYDEQTPGLARVHDHQHRHVGYIPDPGHSLGATARRRTACSPSPTSGH